MQVKHVRRQFFQRNVAEGVMKMEFRVDDMTCSHCVSTITKAVKGEDANATVDIDLQNHLVRIDGAADAEGIMNAIRDAGYTPVPKA
jgi:copper chaperone